MKQKKMFEAIEKVDPGIYDIGHQEMLAIIEKNRNQIFDAAIDAFYYGFLKGQRAARAEMKRKAVQS